MELSGKTGLITGATAGIGQATAEALAAAGCSLYILGRRQDRLEVLATKWRDSHAVSVTPVVCDVADAGSVVQAFAEFDGLARVDIVVNNAGLARGTDPMQTAQLADWEEMVQTNVLGLLRMTRPIAQQMATRGSGHIVNLGSVAGRWVYPGGGVYCATKAAVASLSEGLRYDLLGKGVRVTNIEPGLVETEFSQVRFRGDATRANKVYQGYRPLAAADVANTIIWCLQQPDHVNVQELVLYPTDQAGVRDVHRV